MTAPSQLSQEDAWLQRILSQRREIFFAEQAHLSEGERQRQWELTFARLASTVNSSPSKMQTQKSNINTFPSTQPPPTQSNPVKRRRVVRI